MTLKRRLLFLLIGLHYAEFKTIPNETETLEPRVTFSKGTVEGIVTVTTGGKKVDTFLAVPYGQAPVGNMRFKPALAVQSWTGVLKTNKNSPGCCQKYFPYSFIKQIKILKRFFWFETQSEDCLKLNVWRPHNIGERKLAVMVWFHGGGFQMGTIAIDAYQGHILSSEEEVIVVAVNYRVGSLGFLYLGTDEVPGNAGLQDQLLALRWVHENIAAFGGDPEKVTIFGQSAGGASVGYHLLSPLSSGLFQRAILMSGVPVSPWAFVKKERALSKGRSLAGKLNCTFTNTAAVIKCLQNADVEDILRSEVSLFGMFDMSFLPTVDGHIVLEAPGVSADEGRVLNVDVMIGHTNKEFAVTCPLNMVYSVPNFKKMFPPINMLEMILKTFLSSANETAKKTILTQYKNWTDENDIKNINNAIEKIIAERLFFCPNHRFVEAILKNGRFVYEYVSSYKVSLFPLPEECGVVHGEDLVYVFGSLLFNPNATKADVVVSRRVMRYWANFAKYGDPNVTPAGKDSPYFWRKHWKNDQNTLNIHYNLSKNYVKDYNGRCQFWNNLDQQFN